ncbi:MAG: hypothetical protein WC489_02215 [Patescibacteria group bacterium]
MIYKEIEFYFQEEVYNPTIYIITVFLIVNLFICLKSYQESRYRKNVYGTTPFLYLLGIFVWGDGIIIGLFWCLASLVVFFANDLYLYAVFVSYFWVVRSFGEIIYWLNQQFSSKDRNPAKKTLIHTIFPYDSYLFAYQVFWQCVLVLALIASVYITIYWVQKL